ncbi:MAG: DUF1549 domain-containing protein, partial [Verrucomicrobiales bacterium]|nr:DUF1549 domain-containing protein [Verrucomicrobiales bacterium]
MIKNLVYLLVLGVAPAYGVVSFNDDVRPILSDKCFHCHGPDEKNREAGLRLDTFEGAVADHDGVRALVPGDLAKSEMWFRVTADDEEEVMPPPEAKLGMLDEEELATIRSWIEEGGEYEGHWAFEAVGEVDAEGIDEIVKRGLAGRGLEMQPEAERERLIRRATFDLTGLPPSEEEVEAFLAGGDYGALVERLLASPRFGERMAVDWLDLARYADTFGFQVDRDRAVWPWRDWVVEAFNKNLPYDQFVTWQLAGDLLEDPTDEQILATAFNRLHQQKVEGGSTEEEFRVEYVADRLHTFGTAFLGLSLECSRCHDHKFDPVLQKDYYQLFAFFQNVDEAGLYSYFTPSVPT